MTSWRNGQLTAGCKSKDELLFWFSIFIIKVLIQYKYEEDSLLSFSCGRQRPRKANTRINDNFSACAKHQELAMIYDILK